MFAIQTINDSSVVKALPEGQI